MWRLEYSRKCQYPNTVEVSYIFRFQLNVYVIGYQLKKKNRNSQQYGANIKHALPYNFNGLRFA